MVEIPDEGAIRTLLRDVGVELALELTADQLSQLTTHFLLLLKWNRKINLTSVRRPEEIAWRHFGESLFLLKVLDPRQNSSDACLVDVGSGAGFPGLPVSVLCPYLSAVLLEPNQKKAAFLKEVVQQSHIHGLEVRLERVEDAAREGMRERASLVTMRAVGGSEALLDALGHIIQPAGRVALFLGFDDAARYQRLPVFEWTPPIAIPHSERRVILIGTKQSE